MGPLDRITADPARMNGQPCIRHLRLTVRRVVEAVALYPDREELRREYPELDDEDIRQALAACPRSDRRRLAGSGLSGARPAGLQRHQAEGRRDAGDPTGGMP